MKGRDSGRADRRRIRKANIRDVKRLATLTRKQRIVRGLNAHDPFARG